MKLKMAGKRKNQKAERVWTNPAVSLKGPAGNRAWDHHPLAPPTAARFLELADVALGVKKSSTPLPRIRSKKLDEHG